MANQKNSDSSITKWLRIIGLTGIIIIFILTKPTEDEFKEYINSEIEQKSDSIFDAWMTKFGARLIGSYSTDDYIVFTIHTFSVGEDEIKYVGVFKQFIPLD